MTPSSLKSVSNRALFAYKKWALCKQFSHLRYRIFRSLEKRKFIFQKSPPKHHLSRTGSVFALPNCPNGTFVDHGNVHVLKTEQQGSYNGETTQKGQAYGMHFAH